MEKKSRQNQSDRDDVVFLGTTTLKFMLNAVYDKGNPLYERNTYSECGRANIDAENDPSLGDNTVYVYYHPKENRTIMTNIEGDTWGGMGSSAGFEGKLDI